MLAHLETLFLDMDGTLLDLNFDTQFWHHHLPRRYADIHGVSLADADAHVSGHLRAREGTLNWYCTDFWSATFDLDVMALKAELEHLVQFRPGTEKFLAHLRDRDINVVLLTNAHPDVLALKQRQTGVLDYLDDALTSHELGHAKEHEAFWTALRAAFAYDPDTSLLIDDSLAVLRAARAWGTGHQLRVCRPSSTAAAITCDEFATIDDLCDLLVAGEETP